MNSVKNGAIFPLSRKVILNSISVLVLAVAASLAVSYYGLTSLKSQFSSLTSDRSERVRQSYSKISKENIEKIRSLFENALTTKGHRLLSKDMASLAPLIADNSFLGVQGFLQKTFEDDKDLVSASYFVMQGEGNIQAWHYVSNEYPQGLVFPVSYNVKRKGWVGKTKQGAAAFVYDPEVLSNIQHDTESVRFREGDLKGKKAVLLDCIIPFADGSTGAKVRGARRKHESVGFLRYVLSLEEMDHAIAQEEGALERRLKELETENITALGESERIGTKAIQMVVLYLFLSALIILFLGYSASLVFSRHISGPLKILTAIAESMGRGNYQQTIQVKSNDEIGILASAFQQMSEAIRARDQELEKINKNLENLVQLRTAQLHEENLKISSLLNNMNQAVFAVGDDYRVVAPVSLYSKTVFGREIEGRSIFDFLYSHLDSKGEEISRLKSGLIVLFGEGEIQWMLSENDLPQRVLLKTSDGKDQILKINHSPIYDDQGLVRKIMFVVEDVTQLERLEVELGAQKDRMRMLHELAGNEPESIRNFFLSAANGLSEIVRVSRADHITADEVASILRNIHTIKGNARTLSLTRVSGVAHECESEIVSLQLKEKSKTQLLSEVEQEVIRQVVEKIRIQLNDYQKMANTIMSLKNEIEIKAYSDFAECLVQLGWLLRSDSPDSGQIRSHVQLLNKIATELGEGETARATEALLRLNPIDINKNTLKLWNSLIFIGLQATYKSPLFSQHSSESSIWVGLAERLWAISNSIFILRTSPGPAHKLALATSLEEGISYCSINNLHFYSGYMFQIERKINDQGWADMGVVPDEIFQFESELWSQLLYSSEFYCKVRLTDKERKLLASGLNELMKKGQSQDEVLKTLSKIDIWLVSFLALMNKKNIHPTRLVELWSEKAGVSLSSIASTLVLGAEKWLKERDDLLEMLTAEHWETAWGTKEIDTFHIDNSKNPYLKIFDSLQLFTGAIDDPELLKGRYRILEVLEMNLNKLKSYLLNRFNSAEGGIGLDEVLRAVDRLLEVPLKPALWSFQRAVDDISKRLGKKVHFSVKGEDVMVSRESLSTIQDAVMHIIRNAVDHGLELEEERENLEKPPVGTLNMECHYTGEGDVSVSIEDDGKGIDPEKVAKIAVSKGILDERESARMSAQEKIELIMIAGLSTRDSVTELSGRGVGMDVVKKNLHKLGGSLKIESKVNFGTRFTITFSV